MASTEQVACPICGRMLTSSVIQSHVNSCLNVADDDKSSVFQGMKRKSDETSAWGCLFQHTKRPKSESENGKNVDNAANEEKLKENGPHKLEVTGPKCKKDAPDNSKLNIGGKNNSPGQQLKVSKNASTPQAATPRGGGFAPLAERMRPSSLAAFVGQEQAVGSGSLLRTLLNSDKIPSMILWGPPGCGKTTLAKIIAASCKSRGGNLKFVCLSAAVCGVNEVKEVIKVAKNDQRMLRKQTALFLDEIHRFNKLQQDALLPHVEDGTLILIGATTENPSFQVNSALLSRCRVIVLEKLSALDIRTILLRALDDLGVKVFQDRIEISADPTLDISPQVWMEEDAVMALANLCDGDARVALNGLQMAVQSRIGYYKDNQTIHTPRDDTDSNEDCDRERGYVVITTIHVRDGLQRSCVLYDRAGEEHFNIISAMHKSIRGSDATAALYWLARMLEGGENPLYVARRLVRVASEDIGLADPQSLTQAVAAYQACHFIGMPECDVILAQCVVHLSRAPKSVEVYKAYSSAKECVREHQGTLPSVPLHLRNASTKLMKSLGYAKDYKYNPDFVNPVDQEYLPPELKHINFFQ